MTATAQKYQIVRQFPHFGSYDEITGWSYKRLPYAYSNKELACRIANRLSDGTDETAAFVVSYDGDIRRTRIYFDPTVDENWDLPF